MIAALLMIELDAAGIQLNATVNGSLHIDAPAGTLSQALVDRIRSNKPELLRMLTPSATPGVPIVKSRSDQGLMDDSLEDPVEFIDLSELTPCRACGTLELWQSITGVWRCERCDPPTRGIEFLKHAVRIRQGAR